MLHVSEGDLAASGEPVGEDLLRDAGRGVYAHEQQGQVQLDPKKGACGI